MDHTSSREEPERLLKGGFLHFKFSSPSLPGTQSFVGDEEQGGGATTL